METEAFAQGLKKEFFPRLQNIEPALVPYKPSSLVRNQESNILGWRRIVGESSDRRMNLAPLALDLKGYRIPL